MPRIDHLHRHAAAALRFVIFAAALVAAACGDVNIGPTQPWTPPSGDGAAGIRTLRITGSLTAEQGTVPQATVLFDGGELSGSRVECSEAAGCGKLDLAATTTSPAGTHTISFQVRRQSLEVVEYVAEFNVWVTRAGLPFVLQFDPPPIRATLRAGETVSFQFEFRD